MKLLLSYLLASSALLVLRTTTTAQNTNNAGQIASDADTKTFNDFLASVGISAGEGQTILAPNNGAFDKYALADPTMYAKYFTSNDYFLHRRELLQWLLVTEGRFTVAEIFDGSRTQIANANGNLTIVQVPNGTNSINASSLDGVPRSAIVKQDIATQDGIVHVMDTFIVAPYLGLNLIGLCLDDNSAKFEFATMAQLAIFVDMRDIIDMVYDKGVTLLVPPTRRFNRGQINISELLTEEKKEYTKSLVSCHLILYTNYYESSVFSLHEENDIQETLEISYLGTNIWITTTDDRLRFQAVDLLLPDQVARNGIFHGMDAVLTPPFCSSFCFFTGTTTQYDTSDTYRFFVASLMTSEDIAIMFNTTLTVFSPAREAFAAFNNEDYQRLLEPVWVRHATEFLLNHITTPAMTREELVAKAPGTITMLNGVTYELKKAGTTPKIKNGETEVGQIYFGDLIALDGYVHMMDKVITPTHVSQSIYDQCRNNPDFNLLVENIDFVRLTDLVDRTLPLTMLVTPNKGWERVAFSAVDGPDIINRHIFRGLQFTDVLANLTSITAVNGAVHTIERKGPNGEYIYVGGAYIYEGDILTRNGVMHRIDRVIGLEYPTVPPSSSPAPTITAEPTMYVPPTTTPVAGPVGPVAFTFPPQDAPTKEGSTPGTGGNGGAKSGAPMTVSVWTGGLAPLLVGVAMTLFY